MRGQFYQGLGQGIADAGQAIGNYYANKPQYDLMAFRLEQEKKQAAADEEQAKQSGALNKQALEEISKLKFGMKGFDETGYSEADPTQMSMQQRQNMMNDKRAMGVSEISPEEFGLREQGQRVKSGEIDPYRYTIENMSAESQMSGVGQKYLEDIGKIKMPSPENSLEREKFDWQKKTWQTDRQDKLDKEAKQGISPEQANNANNLRTQFVKLSDDYLKVRDSYNRIETVGKNVSPAGDLALIFNYMKMLDPGSTVREGEFANAQNSGGISDKMRSRYNQVLNGERLSDDQRKDFLAQSKGLYDSAEKTQKNLKTQYSKLSSDMGIDPKFVVNILDTAEPNNASTDIKSQAQQVLNDPESTPQEKSAAMKILNQR